ncbi:copper resistance protein CopC [Kallotenue papyrolyticum]|uniref:copper resistance protein CopC n=1 Tax=Kallotenue papyrolyticum TaxID=1325125 RepID=UPI0009DDC6B8
MASQSRSARRRSGGRGAQVWAPLPPLDDAIYRVGWQVLADDGHASAGEFAFAVGAGGAVPTTTTTSGAISWPDVALSWLLLLGLALGWGCQAAGSARPLPSHSSATSGSHSSQPASEVLRWRAGARRSDSSCMAPTLLQIRPRGQAPAV